MTHARGPVGPRAASRPCRSPARARTRGRRPSPPSRSTRRAAAAAVPPVAITSSTISTRSPGARRRGGSRAGRCRTRARTPPARSPTAACPALRTGHESGTAAVRDRCREHEAARLDPDAPCRSARPRTAPPARRPSPRRRRAREQRCDVAEDDPRLRANPGCRAHAPATSEGRLHLQVPPCRWPLRVLTGSLLQLARARDRDGARARRRALRYASGCSAVAARVAGALAAGSCALGWRPPCWTRAGSMRARRRRRSRRWTPSGRAGHPAAPRPTPTRGARPAAPAPHRGARRVGERPVLRLALLPPRQDRRGDEDRRVRTDEETDGEREREVLERRRTEDPAARRSAATAPAAARRTTSTAIASAPG